MRYLITACVALSVLSLVPAYAEKTDPKDAEFVLEAPAVGDIAPRLTCADTEGVRFALHEQQGRWLFLEFGSHSSPECRSHFAEMENLRKEFAANVLFLFVYTIEAHPDDGPEKSEKTKVSGWRLKDNAVKIKQHKSAADSLAAAQGIKASGKKDWRVLVDGFKGPAQRFWSDLPNCAFLVAPTGRIAAKWRWADDTPIRQFLKKQGNLAPYTVADDAFLPLRNCTEGEWLQYELANGEKERVVFTDCIADSVVRNAGKKTDVVNLPVFIAPEKNCKPRHETFTVRPGLDLPCIVVTERNVETWYSPVLPGDGVAKVVARDRENDSHVLRSVIAAGFGIYDYGSNILIAGDRTKWMLALTRMGDIQKALSMHRLETSRYPQSLDEVGDKFTGSKVPPDPYTGKPFTYEATESGFMLSCLGSDGAAAGEDDAADIVFNEKGLVSND
ncbi:MAG: type II secretion system protein GspG [Planctomycetes bacterium]|nr:type II secretion system protein GspG [Planctomycetota bacterium]